MAINFNPFKPSKSTKPKKVNHSKRYHRKRTKQLIYTTTEIIIVVEKLLASKLLLPNRDWKENSILDVFRGSITKFVAYNVFAGFFASTTFAVVSIFDRVWPHWPEATRARRAWILCALLAVLFMLTSSVYFSVTVAKNLVSMVRVRDGFIPSLDREALAYASLVLTWFATCGTVWSCCLLVSCALRVQVHGPLSKYGREMEAEEIRGKVAEDTERESKAVRAEEDGDTVAVNEGMQLGVVQARGDRVVGNNEIELEAVRAA